MTGCILPATIQGPSCRDFRWLLAGKEGASIPKIQTPPRVATGVEAVEVAPEAMEAAGHLEIAEESMVANKTCSMEVVGTNEWPWRNRKLFLGEEGFSS